MIQKIKSSPECLILQLRADLIMENAREFYEEFLESIDGHGADVLLDFSKTRFIDSSGIGILLKCTESANSLECNLLIHGLNRQMTAVFKLAGLLKIFELVEEDVARERYPELFQA